MDLIMITEHIRAKTFECLIIVHPKIRKLEQASSEILKINSFPVIDIGKELSETLMVVQRIERIRVAQRWFESRVDSLLPSPIMCINTALLFEPSLKLDPLALFRQVGRVTKLVVLWPGEFTSGTLTYAVPGHSHYRTWRITEQNISIYRLDD